MTPVHFSEEGFSPSFLYPKTAGIHPILFLFCRDDGAFLSQVGIDGIGGSARFADSVDTVRRIYPDANEDAYLVNYNVMGKTDGVFVSGHFDSDKQVFVEFERHKFTEKLPEHEAIKQILRWRNHALYTLGNKMYLSKDMFERDIRKSVDTWLMLCKSSNLPQMPVFEIVEKLSGAINDFTLWSDGLISLTTDQLKSTLNLQLNKKDEIKFLNALHSMGIADVGVLDPVLGGVLPLEDVTSTEQGKDAVALLSHRFAEIYRTD